MGSWQSGWGSEPPRCVVWIFFLSTKLLFFDQIFSIFPRGFLASFFFTFSRSSFSLSADFRGKVVSGSLIRSISFENRRDKSKESRIYFWRGRVVYAWLWRSDFPPPPESYPVSRHKNLCVVWGNWEEALKVGFRISRIEIFRGEQRNWLEHSIDRWMILRCSILLSQSSHRTRPLVDSCMYCLV